MVEFVVKDQFSDDDKIGIAVGLSATFRQVLVEAAPSREALEAAKRAVWGALLIKPCPSELPCFKDLEKAADYSEAYSTPVGYDGPDPTPQRRRISTFNKHYLKPWRWAAGGEKMETGHPLLPLMSCLYKILKNVEGVPIVVSDVRIQPNGNSQPDYMVIPTWHNPQEVAEIVDVHLPPLRASAIALGVLLGGYDAGPVVAVVKTYDQLASEVAKVGGYVVTLDQPGDPCQLLEKRVVGYQPSVKTYRVNPALCDKCGECLKTSCPAIIPTAAGHPEITQTCTGCGACAILCTRGAIQ
ncbi:MAG: 4Fe-4S ferredoxin [Pyrobaculum sp.]